MRPIIVVGAGGHALVVADALLSAGSKLLGFTDADNTLTGSLRLGLPILGGDEALAAYEPDSVLLVNGIGGTRPSPLRGTLQHRLQAAGWTFVGVRHPSATVSPFAQVADDAQLLARCVIQAQARIGAGSIVNTGAIVEHNVEVGAFVHLAPGAVVCGDVRIGDGSHVGAGSVVRQGVSLGPRTLIAAGAAVIKNFEGEGLLAGVPAAVRSQA